MEKKLLNIAIAPLIHDNKILLLKRNKPPFRGLWGMPGCKAEFGEHIVFGRVFGRAMSEMV
ncbi:MAG: hypothetical protein FJZ07_01440 [Candidatus Nealsonbacteria bacterium]|nr:hypothetical protein [Candidatus Nealsonbacteria bacterium]